MLLTGNGLDTPEEGLHVLLAGRLVLVEVGPGAGQLVLAVGGCRLVGLVALDLVWKKNEIKNTKRGKFRTFSEV